MSTPLLKYRYAVLMHVSDNKDALTGNHVYVMATDLDSADDLASDALKSDPDYATRGDLSYCLGDGTLA